MNEKGLGRDEKGFSFRAPISSGPNPARPNFSLRVATTYTSFERETDSQAVYREKDYCPSFGQALQTHAYGEGTTNEITNFLWLESQL